MTATMGAPPVITKILINADRPASDRSTRHQRENQRHMARLRDHGVFFVGPALASSKDMNVSISNDRQAEGRASVPELSKGITVENTDAGVVGFGIELVVIDNRCRHSFGSTLLAHQKGAGLVVPLRASVKFARQLRPKSMANSQTGFRSHHTLYSRPSLGGRVRRADSERFRECDPKSDLGVPGTRSYALRSTGGHREDRGKNHFSSQC